MNRKRFLCLALTALLLAMPLIAMADTEWRVKNTSSDQTVGIYANIGHVAVRPVIALRLSEPEHEH